VVKVHLLKRFENITEILKTLIELRPA